MAQFAQINKSSKFTAYLTSVSHFTKTLQDRVHFCIIVKKLRSSDLPAIKHQGTHEAKARTAPSHSLWKPPDWLLDPSLIPLHHLLRPPAWKAQVLPGTESCYHLELATPLFLNDSPRSRFELSLSYNLRLGVELVFLGVIPSKHRLVLAGARGQKGSICLGPLCPVHLAQR